MADGKASRLPDLLCRSEQFAASFGMARMRRADSAGCGDERISLVQTFFVECNIFGPWLARLAGVPVIVGSRRNLNQWHGRSAWMEPGCCCCSG